MTNTRKRKVAEASLEEKTAMFNAVYAPLMGRPVSDQGRAVVARLHEVITAHERTAGTRKYERGKKTSQFDKAIGAFAADLLLAQGHKNAKGWIQRSLRPVSFGQWSSHTYAGPRRREGARCAGNDTSS
jgi:hypothetical protein